MIKRIGKKCLRYTLLAGATIIIAIAVLLNFARLTLPLLHKERFVIERWASSVLHQPVKIGGIRGFWHGFEPELQFANVVIYKGNYQPVVRVQHLAIAINLWQSLLNWKLLPGRLSISGVRFDIYQEKNGHLMVQGVLSTGTQQQLDAARAAKLTDMINWLLTQANVSVDHVDINWRSAKGMLLPIRNLKLKVRNDLNEHRIGGVAKLKQLIPTQVKFVADLQQVDPKLKHLQGRIYLRANNLVFSQLRKLPEIQPYLRGFDVLHGEMSLASWMQLQNGQLSQVQTQFYAQQVGLIMPRTHKRTLFNHMGANVLWQKMPHGWRLDADRISIEINGDAWPQNQFSLRHYNKRVSRVAFNELRLDFLRLQNLQHIGADFGYWPIAVQNIYRNLEPKGEIKQIKLDYAINDKHFVLQNLNLDFVDLAINSWQKIPGFNGLSGRITMNSQGGHMQITSSAAKITLPKLFNQPFNLHVFNADVNWLSGDQGITLSVPQVNLSDGNLTLAATLQLQAPAKGPLTLKLLSGFSLQDSKYLSHYLPKHLFRVRLENWFAHAFPQGSITQGRLVFTGPINDFPFDDHRGVFKFSGNFQHANFAFSKKWPMLKNAQGKLFVNDRHMQVSVAQAEILGAKLNGLQADIPNLVKSKLTLTTQTDTTLQKGLDFLRHSPLLLNKALSGIKAQGSMHLQLHLVMPLYETMKKADVRGSINLENGSLQLANWEGLAITHIVGKVNFHNGALNADGIRANLLGSAIQANMHTLTKPYESILQLELGGQIDVQKLSAKYPLPMKQYYSGVTDFRALLDLHSAGSSRPNSLNVISDLVGVAAPNLPPPYAKLAKQRRILAFHLLMPKAKPVKLKMNYNDEASAALLFSNKAHQFKFYSGEIRMGFSKADYQAKPGLLVTGKLDKVVWGTWKPFIASLLNSDNRTNPLSVPIRYLEFEFNDLYVWHENWHNVYLKLIPKKTAWLINVQSNRLAGVIDFPLNRHHLFKMRLAKLNLPKKMHLQKNKEKPIDPNKIPPLDIQIEHFKYNKLDYGKVGLVTAPIVHGLKIKVFKINSKLFNLAIVGTWKKWPHQMHTAIQGGIRFIQLGQLLKRWGLSGILNKGKGGANFALSWVGVPYKIDMASLDGEVKVNVKQGVITSIGKHAQTELGLGRLLNMFSLQSIPRRLLLNFSDMTTKGFAFNEFKGGFGFSKGVATLQNTVMNGSIARVNLSGKIDFARKHYYLKMFVMPNLTANLPLIVGLAGGPIAGAVTWVLNKFIEPEIGKVAGMLFSVNGPWNKPAIKRIYDKHPPARHSYNYAPVERAHEQNQRNTR